MFFLSSFLSVDFFGQLLVNVLASLIAAALGALMVYLWKRSSRDPAATPLSAKKPSRVVDLDDSFFEDELEEWAANLASLVSQDLDELEAEESRIETRTATFCKKNPDPTIYLGLPPAETEEKKQLREEINALEKGIQAAKLKAEATAAKFAKTAEEMEKRLLRELMAQRQRVASLQSQLRRDPANPTLDAKVILAQKEVAALANELFVTSLPCCKRLAKNAEAKNDSKLADLLNRLCQLQLKFEQL